jgi:putative transposase
MTSKPVAFLLADLGITKTHWRPRVSNDNPYSESQFKTLKYRPCFPDRFLCTEEARSFCQGFFPWYNTEHHHSGIGFLTPEHVHAGHVLAMHQVRSETLAVAVALHPGASSGRRSSRRLCRRSPGSTNRSTQRRTLSNYLADLSQTI